MIHLFHVARRTEDLALFLRHVSGAMRSRVPLPVILRAYGAEAESRAMRKAADSMASRIESGVSFHDALSDHPRLFSSALRKLVRVGEESGTLAAIMGQLADRMEKNLKTYEMFRRAAAYPVIVIGMIISIVTFIFTKIAPRMVAIHAELGAAYPGPLGEPDFGRWMILFLNFLLLIAFAALLAPVMGLRLKSLGYGRIHLQLPLIGPVLRRAEAARFASYLSSLIENKVPMSEALALLSDASDNSYVRSAMKDFQERYARGELLSDLIQSQPLFPPSMAMMVAVAEEGGGLADTLRGLSDFYYQRTEHDLDLLRELYEPLMLIIVGICIGLLAYGMYLPLFELPQHVGR